MEFNFAHYYHYNSENDSSINSDSESTSNDSQDDLSDESNEYLDNEYYNSENLSKTQIMEKIGDIKKMFDLKCIKNEKHCNYMKNDYKINCLKCEKSFCCSMCHNEKSDHKPEYKNTNIICCFCNIEQNFTDYCIGCEEKLKVKYACKKCIIFDNSNKYKYHCNNCNICHTEQKSELKECKKCKVCYLKKMKHICFNKGDECTICFDKLDNDIIVNLSCGHIIHNKCYTELIKNTYKCPLCCKTILDMSREFKLIDKKIEIENEESSADKKIIDMKNIYCNDCEIKTEANYNYLGIKCNNCGSYNTRIY